MTAGVVGAGSARSARVASALRRLLPAAQFNLARAHCSLACCPYQPQPPPQQPLARNSTRAPEVAAGGHLFARTIKIMSGGQDADVDGAG